MIHIFKLIYNCKVYLFFNGVNFFVKSQYISTTYTTENDKVYFNDSFLKQNNQKSMEVRSQNINTEKIFHIWAKY